MANSRNNRVALILGGLFIANLVLAVRNRSEPPSARPTIGTDARRHSIALKTKLPEIFCIQDANSVPTVKQSRLGTTTVCPNDPAATV